MSIRSRLLRAASAVLVAAASTAVAAPADADVTVQRVSGVLRTVVADDFAHGGSESYTVVVTADGEIPVADRVAGGIRPGTPVTATVREGAATKVTASRFEPPAMLGEHSMVMVPVYWEAPGKETVADFTAAARATADYFDTVSQGRISISVDRVLPWTKVADPIMENGCVDLYALYEQAKVAAGVTSLDDFQHLVVYFPEVEACPFAGIAELFGSRIALNGTSSLHVFAHEFGHNLGLEHANGWFCYADAARTIPVTSSENCVSHEYADPFDVMGNNYPGHLGATRLAQLGLLSPESTVVKRTTVAETFTLAPIASGAGLRQVVVPVGGRNYSLEYRQSTGPDSWMGEWNVRDGLTVAFNEPDADPIFGDRSTDLLDFHPTARPKQPVLMAGESWEAPDGSFAVTVGAVSATGLQLTVTRSAAAPVPTPTPSPSKPTTPPGPKSLTLHFPAPESIFTERDVDVRWRVGGLGFTSIIVELDGKAAVTFTAAGGGLRQETTLRNVADGAHTVRIVGAGDDGSTTVSGVSTFGVDASGPTVKPAPTAALRTGAVSPGGELPVTVSWGGVSDPLGVNWAEIAHRAASGEGESTGISLDARSTAAVTTPDVPNGWRIYAVDMADNRSVTDGPWTTPAIDNQSARGTGYTGKWATVRRSGTLGGSEQVTTVRGAKVTYTTTARSLAWIATKDATKGVVTVYVDGRKAGTVNLHSRTAAQRQIVFTRTWPASGRHTITLVNTAAKGRPGMGVDAFATLS